MIQTSFQSVSQQIYLRFLARVFEFQDFQDFGFVSDFGFRISDF